VNVHGTIIATGSLATLVLVVLDKAQAVVVCIETVNLNIVSVFASFAPAWIAPVKAWMLVEHLEPDHDVSSLISHLPARLDVLRALAAWSAAFLGRAKAYAKAYAKACADGSAAFPAAFIATLLLATKSVDSLAIFSDNAHGNIPADAIAKIVRKGQQLRGAQQILETGGDAGRHRGRSGDPLTG